MFSRIPFFVPLLALGSLSSTHAQHEPELVGAITRDYNFSNPVLFAGKAAFFIQGLYEATAVAEVDANGVNELFNFSTLHPSSQIARLTGFYNIAGDSDYLYFTGNSSSLFGGSYGLFRYDGSELVALVPDASELAPENKLTGLSGVKAGGGKTVFFVRQNPSYEAYYLHDGEQLTLIADLDTSVAEGSGKIIELPTVGASISANGEHVIIRVKTALGAVGQSDLYVIYRFLNGSLVPIVKRGDSIGNGYTISNIPSQPVILDDGSVLLNVHTIPSGQGLVCVSPENEISMIPIPLVEGGATASLSGVASGADDGTSVYGLLTTYNASYAILERKAVRYTAEGEFEELFSVPFQAEGESWGDSGFQFVAANSHGYVLKAQNTSGEERTFSNIDYILSSDESSGASLWAGYDDFSGWKFSSSLEWLYDGFYPYIYSSGMDGWLYVTGFSLSSYYFFSFELNSWYWTSEDFGGWAYHFAGGQVDPGWVYLH